MIFLYSTEHVPRVQLLNIYICDHYICFAEVVSLIIRALLTFTHLASAKYRQQDERKKKFTCAGSLVAKNNTVQSEISIWLVIPG